MAYREKRLGESKSAFFRSDVWPLLLLWLLAFGLRMLYSLWDQTAYSLIISDAVNYYRSGLDFIRTGRILFRGRPTALIMPGTPVLIGLVSLLFPEGPSLLWALRILWMFMGSLVPLFLYRSLRLFAPRWCAFAGSLVYLLPWHVEIDGYLLTECPYYLFFAMALYFTLKLGEEDRARDRWGYALSTLAALMFRPNILIFTVFSFLYWLIRRRSGKEFLRRGVLLCAVLAVFIVPWTLRNARLYHDFIPVSYGAWNPMMEGSFQGGAPSSEEMYALEPEFNPYTVLREERPDLINGEGQALNPELQEYATMRVNREVGRHRLRLWWKTDPVGLLKAYLYIKPRSVLNWVWYYIEWGIPIPAAHDLRILGFCFCGLSFVLAFVLKKHRRLIAFLTFTYFANLLLLSTSYVIDRYAQMLMPYRLTVPTTYNPDVPTPLVVYLHGGSGGGPARRGGHHPVGRRTRHRRTRHTPHPSDYGQHQL